MITKEEVTLNFLQYATKTWRGPDLPRHYILAHKVLRGIAGELEGIEFIQLDKTWPFRILVLTKYEAFCSVYCSGFDKRIDIQMLTRHGHVDHRYHEVSRRTPKGAVNFIERRYGIGN